MDDIGTPFPAVLTLGRCMELLSGGGYGRVAVTEQALPVIVPVNYCLAGGGELLIATGSRTGLVNRARDTVITFEAGGVDAAGWAWSVTVTGYARSLAAGQRERARGPWAPGAEEELLCLETTEVDGRVFPLLNSADGHGAAVPWPGGAPAGASCTSGG